MLALGISKWHPDPVASCEAAQAEREASSVREEGKPNVRSDAAGVTDAELDQIMRYAGPLHPRLGRAFVERVDELRAG
jgi:hypothetical protein